MRRFLGAILTALGVALAVAFAGLYASGVRFSAPAFLKRGGEREFDERGAGFLAAASDLLDRADLDDPEAVRKAADAIWGLTEDPKRRARRAAYYEQLLALAAPAPSDDLALELVDRMARALSRGGTPEEVFSFQKALLRLLEKRPTDAMFRAALEAHAGPLGSAPVLAGSAPFFGRLLALARDRSAAGGEAERVFERSFRAAAALYAPEEGTQSFDAFAREAVSALRTMPRPEPVLRVLRLVQRDFRADGRRDARRSLAAAVAAEPWTPEFRDVELEALQILAVASAEAGDEERTLRAIAELDRRMPEASAAQKARALLAEGRARAIRGEAPPAEAAFGGAWARARTLKDRALDWEVLLHRSRLLEGRGAAAKAAAGFAEAVAAVEALGPGDWAAEAEEPPAAAFAAAIAAAAKRGDRAAGYAFTERARAFLAGAPPPPDAAGRLAALQARLAEENAHVVEFLSAGDRLFTWYVGPASADLAETAVDEAGLRRRADAFAGALSFDIAGKREQARALFEFLFRRDLLPEPGSRLAVVPQGPLAEVPFAELVDGDAPLGARYALTVAAPPAPGAGAASGKEGGGRGA